MSDVPYLVCACGKRLRAPGAAPGRVGRCPACGGLMRVPEFVPTEPEPEPDPAPDPDAQCVRPEAATAVQRPRRRKKKARPAEGTETAIWDGLVAPPPRLETHTSESLLYPFWGAHGVASLVIFPPLLWLTSVPLAGAFTAVPGGGGAPLTLVMLIAGIPAAIGLFAVGGFALLFLARVLASSAIGEVRPPRWPDWELSAMAAGLGRWLWASVVGLVVGGVPATAYWVWCGDVDVMDLIILAELLAAGAVYALMGLVASILHEDLWAANPVTVVRAIGCVGLDYLGPCLACGAAAVVSGLLLGVAFEAESPGLSAAAMFAFWLVGLYAAMVVLRRLGLCYHRHARALGWFRGRTGWGV